MIHAKGSTWPDALPTVLQKLRGTVNESTGLSPYQMLMGRTPRMALDLILCNEHTNFQFGNGKHTNPAKNIAKMHKFANEVMKETGPMIKIQYDKKRSPNEIKVGDLVLWHHDRVIDKNQLHIPAKFKSKLHGPFEVIGTIGKNAFLLKNNATGEVIKEGVHAEKLRKYEVRREFHHQKEVEEWEGLVGGAPNVLMS
jgi:hypothetical protein